MGPKLGGHKINISSGSIPCPLDGDRQGAWMHRRFLEKAVPTCPLPGGGSHQDLLSSLWQPKSNEATANERSGGQKDRDNFGYPDKRSKDGVSENGPKFAQSIEDAKGGCPEKKKKERKF